jgi:hypothetical protein
MVVTGGSGKGASIDLAPVLFFHIAQDEAALAAEEGLMGAGRHQKGPFF